MCVMIRMAHDPVENCDGGSYFPHFLPCLPWGKVVPE